MEHEEIAARLSEYRDGELSAPRRAEVARHLSSCASCAAALADWERLARVLLPAPRRPTAA
ncbi:MAG: zf-HC2 domain-containing protein, partial [Elusimicrobia bacterium]|nr:zf-HC2 domain-containing protein [Elusimicrobiota bacterium]